MSGKNSEEAKKALVTFLKSFDVKVLDIKNIRQTRTLKQNNSLHLLFEQLSKECLEKGIDMRVLVKKEFPIEATPENLKMLWKKLQYALFGTKSTTELKRDKQIEIVYDNFNKIFIERTKGEICLPSFPSIQSYEETQIKNLNEQQKAN